MSFRPKRLTALAAIAAAPWPSALAQPDGLEEIVVTADFRQARIEELPVSVTVLDREQLRATTQQHFEEAIRSVPNLNLSGEGSRARYFQLRGVGELEQYDGAPNPSIGFIVDDIDFSGLGSIGTLFDVDRVEVLRGPQGTRYGANALGGLVYMRSRAPSATFTADVEATMGSDGTDALGAAIGGPLTDALGFRASVHTYGNSGFRDNVFLRRDDTYGRDELTARGKLAWSPRDGVQVDFAGLYVDVDNGYDAWAIDNGFNTYSDKPGRDAQQSAAASARVLAELDRVDLVSITGFADTDAVFSFDADWGNAAYWAPYVYDYVTSNDRERRMLSQEIRLLSKPGAIGGGRGDWIAGVYVLDIDERNDHLDVGVYDDDSFCDPCELDNPSVSDYGATNFAVFGQVALAATDRLGVTLG
jgi:iron complex outermembrane receptor protein